MASRAAYLEPIGAFQAMRAAIDNLARERSVARAADLPRYTSAEAVVEALQPHEPIFCLRPDELRRAAGGFSAFRGRVLYAVKCNPNPSVLTTLYESGITDFDVASINEMETIHSLFGTAGMFFNNPAKSRASIRLAQTRYGVGCFTVDHESELEKILDEVDRTDDLVIAVRLATRPQDARYALTTKFGASAECAQQLLKRVHSAGVRSGLTFHVGSQCLAPGSFVTALRLCAEVTRNAGTPLDVLNVGGGFPVDYPGDDAPPLSHFLAAIAEGLREFELPQSCRLFCEPGRSLVAAGGSVIAQVLVRKDGAIYLNDGIFGSLQELRHPKERRPARVVGRADAARQVSDFKVYGPTCDSDDVLGAPLALPEDIREGDWIEIGMMGAYSLATRTNFNGFAVDKIVSLAD